MQQSATVQRHWDGKLEEEMESQAQLNEQGKILAKRTGLTFGNTKMGYNALAVSPRTGFALRTLHAHVDIIAPGGKTGLHRHSSEAVVMVLKGSGYTTIGENRYDWEEGDIFVVPSGAWHQYFNGSDSEPVHYYAVTNWPLTVSVGLSYNDFAEYGEGYVKEHGQP